MKTITQLMSRVWVTAPLLCCLHFQTSAQDVASLTTATSIGNNENRRQDGNGSRNKPLKKYLAELEARYKVSFNYDSELIQNLVVESQEVSESIESSLNTVLESKGLQCKKIGDKTYVIYPKSDTLLPRKTGWNTEPDTDASGTQAFTQEGIDVLGIKSSLLQRSLTEVRINATITGRVTDEKGEGLPGVSVVVKGTTTGTATDVNGAYSLNVPDLNGTLVFSFVGYLPQEVAIANREAIDISLAPDVKTLNEVVVIGYQSVARRDLTGAVSTISPAQANRVTANSVAESLQGLAAGVTVRNTGQPGVGAKIDIRGAGTFGANEPLYVIDGMLSSATPDFNPNDIESIQILKDASATAIYGSAGNSGVILITTKNRMFQGNILLGKKKVPF